jgi:cytochrome c oxidase subunit 4
VAEKEQTGQSVKYKTYIFVWLGLLLLTVTTVAVSKFRLTGYAVPVALLIATAKAALVITFFMHLRYEPRILKLMLLIALVAFTLILLLTFSDVWYR